MSVRDTQGELNTEIVRRIDALEIKMGWVSRIVFGAVALVLVAFFTALIALVVVKPKSTAVSVHPTNIQTAPARMPPQ